MQSTAACIASTLFLGVVVLCLSAHGEDRVAPPTDAESLVKFVQRAAELVAREGDASFAQLNNRGGPWFHGDTYVVVNTRLGETLVNPASPALVGKNMHDLLDPNGRAVLGLIIRSVSWSKGAGWAHYLWPRPGEMQPTWKSTYSIQVTAPSGRLYLVGSGLYDLPMNRLFLEDAVDRAAERITALGDDAFRELNDKLGPYQFRDTYVFVFDIEGKEWVSPDFPELAGGRNILTLNYGDEISPARKIIEGLQTTDRGWFDYHWPAKRDGAPALKSSYARRVQHRGQTYIVAAGMFAK